MAPRTLWSSWDVEHPSLLRCVPHNRSLLKLGEQRLSDFLLDLIHELTHVYSLMGALGLATLGARFAIADLEVTKWAIRLGDGAGGIPDLRVVGSRCPLDGAHVGLLLRTEQQLEIALKIRAIESTWSCWLEGIAVFGELAPDPLLDEERTTLTTPVVLNFLDHHRAEGANQEDVKREIAESYESAERLVSAAIKTSGKYRLRSYLDNPTSPYPYGYVLVRRLVATWRSRLDEGLNGLDAFNMLLAVTTKTDDLIPDLSLPLSRFKDEARTKLIEWYGRMVRLTDEELRKLRRSTRDDHPDAGVAVLMEGLASVSDLPEERTDGESLLASWRDEAIASLTGLNDVTSRFGVETGAFVDLLSVATAAIEDGRQEGKSPNLAESTALFVLNERMVLPVARARCAFWMFRAERRIACLLRTAEPEQGQYDASYDLRSIVVPDASFRNLIEEWERLPTRRILVTRVVDLGRWDPESDSVRPGGIGRHFYVYSYGEWCHVEPAGFGSGTQMVIPEEVQAAIARRIGARSDRRTFLELIEDQDALARDALEWVEKETRWHDDALGTPIDVEPLARRIEKLARELSEVDVDEGRAGRALARDVYTSLGLEAGPDLSNVLARLSRDGSLQAWLEAVLWSGLEPSRASWEDESLSGSTGQGQLFCRTGRGWDFAPLSKETA